MESRDFNISKKLGTKADEILEISERIFKYKSDIVLKNALLSQLKTYKDNELLTLFEDEENNLTDVELYLRDKSKYMQSSTELLDDAFQYVLSFCPESLNYQQSKSKKKNHIVLRKFIGYTKNTFSELFLISSIKSAELERTGFIETYVDTYVRNHVNDFLKNIIENSDSYQFIILRDKPIEKKNGWISYDLEFLIPFEKLTEQNMIEFKSFLENLNFYLDSIL